MNRKNKIRIYSLALATVMGVTSLTGCCRNGDGEIPKPVIADEYNEFDKFVKTRIVDGEAVQCYRGENIAITINKDTNEIGRYIYNKEFLLYEVYELDTGDMIVYHDYIATTYGEEYFENLCNSSDIVNFVDIDDYLEGETCKEWYTLEEIQELEPKILEAILKIREAENTRKKTK